MIHEHNEENQNTKALTQNASKMIDKQVKVLLPQPAEETHAILCLVRTIVLAADVALPTAY
jgi:hypothetical protein